MAVRFLGVIGHQGFELGLGSLVVEKRRAGGAEEAGPTSSTRSCRRPEPPRREDAVVRCRKAEVSPRFGRSVSAHETAHRASAISLTANIRERGPIQSASRRSRGGYHRPSRRRLIVMFLDLANSTRLAEEMGELRAHDLPRTVAWSRRRPRGRANSEADQDDSGRSGAARFPWIVEWPYVPPVMATGPTPSNS
jgi:hypothetical protein